MTDKEKLELIQDFTSKKEVQDFINKINNSLMEFNILKITGMGTQEIKHSHLLAWMFGDNEHKFQYKILDSFLQKVIDLFQEEKEEEEKNKSDKDVKVKIKELQNYISIPYSKRNAKIYREKDDIDLLIVDEANKIVITIENKVFAPERVKKGKKKGQLATYEQVIKEKYKNFEKYFIFLTQDLREAKSTDINEKWLKANYQMISNTLDILMETNETDEKTKLVLESYIDLLKRSNIVEDKELKKLCEEIWLDKNYKTALEILCNYKTTELDIFFRKLINTSEIYFVPWEKDSIQCIKTKVHDLLTKSFTSDTNWHESEEFTIELQLVKHNQYLWFGYRHPNANNLIKKYPEFKTIYEKLFPDKKIQEEHTIKYIKEQHISEDLIPMIKKEIKKFEKIVKSVLQTS